MCVVLISNLNFGPGNPSRFHIHRHHVFFLVVYFEKLSKLNFAILTFRSRLSNPALYQLTPPYFKEKNAGFTSINTKCFYIHLFKSIDTICTHLLIDPHLQIDTHTHTYTHTHSLSLFNILACTHARTSTFFCYTFLTSTNLPPPPSCSLPPSLSHRPPLSVAFLRCFHTHPHSSTHSTSS